MCEFSERSLQVCQDFLQTAVVIDDRAFDKLPTSNPNVAQTPGRGEQQPSKYQKKSPKAEGLLNTQRLIESFADIGIFCSALEFTDFEEKSLPFKNIARSADIVIIDWEMEAEKSGANALKLISSLLKDDFSYPQRFRLVTIYTGHENLADISQKVVSHIKNHHSKELNVDQDGLRLSHQSIVISIFAKKHSLIPAHFKKNTVDEGALPKKIVGDFSESISGILPNTALAAVSAIRHSTHQLLSRFNKNLDYAFLTHRASSPKPDDAAIHLETFIGEEIKSILSSFNCIGSNASFRDIKNWIKQRYSQKHEFTHPDGTKLIRKDILELLRMGSLEAKISTDLSKNKRKQLYRHFSKMLTGDELVSLACDLEFSSLSVLKTRYNSSSPHLTTGVILQQLSNKTLWICIQPKCDAVRLAGKTGKFPLLPIQTGIGGKSTLKSTLPKLSNESAENFCHILIHPQNCRTIEFKSAKVDKSQIHPQRTKDKWVFLSTEKLRFQFIAELKDEVAQKVLNDFAATTARVGINSSEWLLKSGNGE